nr:MAG TPA: hypothetical protein [Caudoviricetes sp.]
MVFKYSTTIKNSPLFEGRYIKIYYLDSINMCNLSNKKVYILQK